MTVDNNERITNGVQSDANGVQSDANEAAEDAKPINLTFRGRLWVLDFNRRALQRIDNDEELAGALDLKAGNIGFRQISKWEFTMPRIMVIASAMHNVPPMPLSTAEDAFQEMGKTKIAFASRMAGLYIARLAEIAGFGNEDLVDDAEDNAGNAIWE